MEELRKMMELQLDFLTWNFSSDLSVPTKTLFEVLVEAVSTGCCFRPQVQQRWPRCLPETVFKCRLP